MSIARIDALDSLFWPKMWKGRDPAIPVAVKIIPKQKVKGNEHMYNRFSFP